VHFAGVNLEGNVAHGLDAPEGDGDVGEAEQWIHGRCRCGGGATIYHISSVTTR
jgi:hypothetical protein